MRNLPWARKSVELDGPYGSRRGLYLTTCDTETWAIGRIRKFSHRLDLVFSWSAAAQRRTSPPQRRSRVENGTGKSRPDRLRLPFKPTVNRFREKNGKMEKQNGKTGGNGNGNGCGVFPTVFTVPVFSRENSRGNSRICRSRLCYLCWKRELLFACVPT